MNNPRDGNRTSRIESLLRMCSQSQQRQRPGSKGSSTPGAIGDGRAPAGWAGQNSPEARARWLAIARDVDG